jgi:hypothetical protein
MHAFPCTSLFVSHAPSANSSQVIRKSKRTKQEQTILDTQCHNRIDNIIVILLQGLYSLWTANIGLGHDELNILVLYAIGVNLLSIVVVIVVVFLVVGLLGGLAVVTVVVASVVGLGVGLGELGSSGLLSGGVQVLDLGLTENTEE